MDSMIENHTIAVPKESAGLRADRFVAAQIPSSTRALAERAFERGDILVNNRPATKGLKLRAGDTLHIARLLESADNRAMPNRDLPLYVIYEDDSVLVLDKPAGMPVHPLSPDETGTLANALLARHPELAEIGSDRLFPSILHRLDTDTSGVVLAARTSAAYDFLRTEFRERRVKKEYIALVRGRPPGPARLEHYLSHDPKRRGRMLAAEKPGGGAEKAMRAVTEFSIAKTCGKYTLLDVVIRTGVTHQIRCQLAAAGYPIACDPLYGGAEGELGLKRHFLHAAAIEFAHPGTGKNVRFEAAMPADLKAALKTA